MAITASRGGFCPSGTTSDTATASAAVSAASARSARC
ncbi:Uncharacterised protein [Mycobacteroides abscessus subsp. abscessus]|nr:Uncharacterised protein [Mycobacteroides abscessus subsp. abscessus]